MSSKIFNRNSELRQVMPLGDVVDKIFLGLSLARQPKGAMQTIPASIVNVKDFVDGFLPSLSELQSVDVPETSQTDKFRLSPGDVLISARGTIKVAGVLQAQEGAIAGANLIVVRPGKTLAGPLVLAFLRHATTQAKLERLSAGTTVASLNVSAVAALQVNVPPSEKQAKLAKLVQLADEHHVAARRAAELRLKLAQEAAMRALTV